MDRRHFNLVILFSLIFGAVGGAVIGPVVQQRLGNLPQTVIREVEKPVGTLQQTSFTDEEAATIDVVGRANPAVVSIAILQDVSEFSNSATFPFDDFFFEFGNPYEIRLPEPKPRNQRPKNNEPQFRQVGGGSGFVIEPNGLIVTNRHVVDNEEAKYMVILSDGKEYEATIVAKDPVLDVALIKIDAADLATLPLGDSEKLKLGQTVIAIGNALSEFGNTVTRGVVSGVGRRVEAGDGRGFGEVIDEAIQTDAAINPGNSGGPLLNLAGEVVGINTAVSREGQLIGFAIPINSLKKTIESVQKNGRIVRPWLGVRYQPVTPRLAEVNSLSVTYGALVLRGENPDELAVIPGSPANKAGIVENDIILEINGKKLEDKDSLAKIIGTFSVGDEVAMKILRKGEEKTVKVMLGEFPTE